MVYLGLDTGMCKECYYFNGTHCTNHNICWGNSLFKKNEIKQVKERTHVNMFVDDMKKATVNTCSDCELVGQCYSSRDIEYSEETEACEEFKRSKIEEVKETVDHPSHYNKGIEAIEYIESHNFNFNLGNAIKYITRCEHKNNKSEDIKKAIWYLERELKKGE